MSNTLNTCNCIIIGGSSCGKTSLIQQYCNRRFAHDFRPTIGMDVSTKAVALADGTVTLNIKDTAGQERFRSLNAQFYRGSEVCVVVFDLTQPETFDDVQEWIDDFRRFTGIDRNEKFPFFIVGNKTDLENERAVGKEDAARWAAQRGYQYHETSAKLADGVDQLFRAAAEAAVHRRRQVAYLDEGSSMPGPQRARLAPVKPSATAPQAQQESKFCSGGCGKE